MKESFDNKNNQLFYKVGKYPDDIILDNEVTAFKHFLDKLGKSGLMTSRQEIENYFRFGETRFEDLKKLRKEWEQSLKP